MLKIRLSRTGKKNQPSFKVVVQEHTAPIKGKFVEELGFYRHAENPKVFKVNMERIKYWISVGAAPSDTLAVLLKKEGLNLVVALRGDAPQKTNKFTPPLHGFSYANELVDYLKQINGFSIAVAGYPEGHIEAPNKNVDLENLKRKVDAGADSVITQLFFDNKDYFDFVNRARKIGISIPIIPGILPILNVKQVERLAGLCGAKIQANLHQKLLQCGEDILAMREIGIEHATTQCQELIKKGAPGIHFYMLNKAHSVEKILANL